jgi:anaerobic magnesium-protoporphyrin IX monomethyl ester cyclase
MVYIHIGLSYVSAYLKSQGHSTRLVVLSSERPSRSLSLLKAAVAEFDPQLVGFTAVASQYPFISLAAQRLRQLWPRKFLILGGIQASLTPDEAIQGGFDAICVGEGELPTAELVAQMESGQSPHRIPNLWIKQPDGTIEKNPTRNFLTDLEGLPFPDREIWNDWAMQRPRTHQTVLCSRGCPYNCPYCANHALRKLAAGKYVRLRAPVSILQEIQDLKQRYPDTIDINLESETIAVNLDWLYELTEQIRVFNHQLDKEISFTCQFRVARPFLTDQVFGALERANVRTISIGLESGSERIRREVLGRHYSNEEFLQAVELARRHGMNVSVLNMIGVPGETLADHLETIELNRRAWPNRSHPSIFFPYPGTDLAKTCKAQGLLPAGNVSAELGVASLDYPKFRKPDIQRAYDWFQYRVYKGRRPLYFRLLKVVKNKGARHAWAHLVVLRLLPLWHALRDRKDPNRRAQEG